MGQGTVAILGGTGKFGRALARRLAAAGVPVIIGSRRPANARRAARELGERVRGAANREAAAAADVIVLAVPYAGHRKTADAIAPVCAGKVVIDVAVPLVMKPVPRVERPAAGSLAQEAAARLPQAKVVAGLHTVSAHMLDARSRPLHGDALLCGDDPWAKEIAARIVRAAGLRPIDAGDLSAAHTLELLGGLMLHLNRRYGRKDLGIAVAGLD